MPQTTLPDVHEQLTRRLVELLGDGHWHNYEATIRELGKLIPPGVAIRKCEQERRGEGVKQRGGRPAPPERRRELPVERQIEQGRRSLVRVFLKNRPVETDRPGHTGRRLPDRQIRMVR